MKRETKFFILLYSATIIVSVLYFFFISDHNFFVQRELNRKMDNLENSIAKTKNSVNNRYTYEQLSLHPQLLEQYARESLNMHKPDEDVFIIVYE